MAATQFRIVSAQRNLLVGDIPGNAEIMIRAAAHARDQLSASMIVFPELALTAYPPEDLLLRPDFLASAEAALALVAEHSHGIAVVVGYPERDGQNLFNSVAVLKDGCRVANYRKQNLPNYGVFDEKRYFAEGTDTVIFDHHGIPVGLSICEDVWSPGVVEKAAANGAKLIINLNASPFHVGKQKQREAIVRERVKATGIPVVYVNQIGGQDELLFDGGSFVMDSTGAVISRSAAFAEDDVLVDILVSGAGELSISSATGAPYPSDISSVYQALVLAIRDYAAKNGFRGVLLGLSGGIDSALTLALAVDALGAEQVEVVLMPSVYTASMSNEDARKQAEILGVRWHKIPIMPAVEAFSGMLESSFAGSGRDVTEENIQARCRGVVLMALSNKKGLLLLTTGNKSEMSVGYATLYGDMAGGFAPLKDVPKLLVYQLSHYVNRSGVIIPPRVIERPPSAELAPDQKDSDSLLAYEVLDPILKAYVEDDKSIAEISAMGFSEEDIRRVITLVDRNEYKRRQAPPGVRITSRAFGRDRRLPLTSGFRP